MKIPDFIEKVDFPWFENGILKSRAHTFWKCAPKGKTMRPGGRTVFQKVRKFYAPFAPSRSPNASLSLHNL